MSKGACDQAVLHGLAPWEAGRLQFHLVENQHPILNERRRYHDHDRFGAFRLRVAFAEILPIR